MISPDTRITRIREVMARGPQIAASATLRQAADKLQRSHVDGLIVLCDDGDVSGVLAERDLVFAAQAESEGHSGLVGDYVNKRFMRAQENEAVEEVLHRMGSLDLHRAIVFDSDQNPTGLIAPEPISLAASGHADFILEVDGERFGASASMRGDSTRDPTSLVTPGRITVGVTALGARRLRRLAGREARLVTNARLDTTGASREVARLRLVDVDVDLALVVAEPR